MPEGPEIHRLRDRIDEHITGQTIRSVEMGPSSQQAHISTLVGLEVRAVRAHGKSITFELSDGWSMFTHTMLYGKWYVYPQGQGPAGSKKVGVILNTDAWSAQLYSTGRIEVLRTDDVPNHAFLKKLGPDVIDPTTTTQDIYDLVIRKRSSEIGALLLDQSYFAGVGNYLRTEALWLAGLRPERTVSSLTEDELRNLIDQAIAVTRRCYDSKGFTPDDAHLERFRAQGKGRAWLKRYIYTHAGEPCPKCETTIEEQRYKKRRLFFCPTCQPA